jgi:hypothetical protein
MSTQAPFSLHAVPSSSASPAESWDDLDAELGRWLRMRDGLRTKRSDEPSSLDGMAMALRRVQMTLEAMADATATAAPGTHDARIAALVTRAYRWAIRVARELDTIEQLELDSLQEWARFEAFAPFAQASFEGSVRAASAGLPRTPDVVRLERDLDAVMAPVSIALLSSAWAA